jgi:NAD(P)-dependent dehydrogenase (short-subunit alcohol dehydrogenase family)
MGLSGSKPTKHLPAFEENLPSLEGKTVAITGCTSGTGLVVAKVCVRQKVDTLLLLNRPSERATRAEAEIRAEIPQGAKVTVETVACDLQDLESVRAAATNIKSQHEAIDVLCNNAGIMAMEETTTKDGYDVQTGTNHLSHFLLTKELFPLLQRAQELRGDARIVNHSSMARRGSPLKVEYFAKNDTPGSLGGNGARGKWERYHQSKLAQPLFTLALAEKLKGKDNKNAIKAVCAAPGYSITNLQTTSQGMGGLLWSRAIFAQSAEDGTMPLLQCAFGTDVASGDFWEPGQWSNLAGLPVKVELTNECTDPESQKLLWEASEKACGKFDI